MSVEAPEMAVELMGGSMKMQVKAYTIDESDGLMLWELAQLNVQSGAA